jgi:hypothetical protein
MAPKNLVKELIEALSDDTVASAIGTIFERKLQEVVTAVRELKAENDRQTVQIAHLQTNLSAANEKIEALETYSRSQNLIVCGLPVGSYSGAIESAGDGDSTNHNSNAQ